MKVAFPLWLKVSLWLLVNLLLIAVIAGGWLVFGRGGPGGDALIHGSAGERLQAVANLLSSQLRTHDASEADRLLEGLPRRAGVSYWIVNNDTAEIFAGEPARLPAEVMQHVQRGSRRRGEAPPRGAAAFGPGIENLLPRDGPPPGNEHIGDPSPDDLARGRSLLRAGDPAAWWAVVRMPPFGPTHPPTPASLVVRASSIFAVMNLLNLTPWFVTGALVLVVSILFWLPLVHSVTKSLHQLTVATGEIAEGRFAVRVPETRRDEIGHLGQSVNRMASRLDSLVHGQKRFLGDVAHELGSPLARLQFATGILEQRVSEELRPAVGDVREEVQRMSDLVSELLAFTKAGLKARQTELTALELAPLAARVLTHEGAHRRCTVEISGETKVRADGALLERALENLVRNALRHAPDSELTLTAKAANEHVLVTFSDNGPGVPSDALPRLGEPFYRPEAARTRETGGTGLGLAIVRSAIEACQGAVSFRNRSPHGFEAEIRLLRG